MTKSEAQLEIMLEVKNAWAKGYLNWLWIEMEIERIKEDVNLEEDYKLLLEDQTWNCTVEGPIQL